MRKILFVILIVLAAYSCKQNNSKLLDLATEKADGSYSFAYGIEYSGEKFICMGECGKKVSPYDVGIEERRSKCTEYLDYGREEWFPKDIQKVLLSPNEGHKQLETQTTMYAEQIRKIFDSRKVVDSTIPQDISEHNKSNTPENSSSLPPGITEHKTPAPETSNPAMEICLKGKTMQGVLVAKEQEEKKRKEKFEGNKQRISENGTCSYECVSKWYLKQGTTFVWKQTENRCKNYTTCRYGPEDPFGNAIACRREGSVGSSPCI